MGGITPNTLNTRIKELREAGLMHHNGDGYSVTVAGRDLLSGSTTAGLFAAKWVAVRRKKKQGS